MTKIQNGKRHSLLLSSAILEFILGRFVLIDGWSNSDSR